MVQLIQWRGTLEVGHDMIDADHRVLVQMMNDLLDIILNDRGREAIAPTLDGLVAYTATHFAREEVEMRRTGYPGLESHLAEHRAFRIQVGAFKEQFDAGETALTMGVMKFLRNWLTDHILTVDKQLAAFLNKAA